MLAPLFIGNHAFVIQQDRSQRAEQPRRAARRAAGGGEHA